jgi:hypothetical protein
MIVDPSRSFWKIGVRKSRVQAKTLGRSNSQSAKWIIAREGKERNFDDSKIQSLVFWGS